MNKEDIIKEFDEKYLNEQFGNEHTKRLYLLLKDELKKDIETHDKKIKADWLKILEKKENHYKLREKLVIEEVKKEIKEKIKEDLLIKCECENGDCPNCKRTCQLLDELTPNK